MVWNNKLYNIKKCIGKAKKHLQLNMINDRSFQRTQHEELFQHLRLARLPDLAGQEHLVHHCVHFVEVEHQI